MTPADDGSINRTNVQRVYGAGGGKSGSAGGGTPQEAPNTLQSRETARIIDILSEGEIEGFVDGDKSIFFDGTPLQSESLAYNFNGVTVASRTGGAAQTYIPGFPAAETETAVGVEVTNAAPVVRRVSDLDADAVRVTLQIPALTQQDTKTGDLNGYSVDVRIQVKSDADNVSSVYVTKVDDHIVGKNTRPYSRSYRIGLDGVGPWDIKVIRDSVDEVVTYKQNKTTWSSYTAIIDRKLLYPDTAVVGLTVNSELFGSNIPTRGYEIYGIRCKVPTNYDPIARTYTGAWDGTFKTEWTDCPPWILYDICTNDRYGLGDLFASTEIDKWGLYSCAQYCDQLVDDGKGGTEPRFRLNTVINTRENALKVLEAVSGMFRSALLWSSGWLSPIQDRPKNATRIFTPANVIDGMFNYTGTALTARHTFATVKWINPAKGYEQDTVIVEDADGILRYGYNGLDITAYGCTSYGQAYRTGLYALTTERLETDTVQFKIGLAEADMIPGEIIKIADPAFTTADHGGRLRSADETQCVMDRPFNFEAGKVYTLNFISFDGSMKSVAITNPEVETDTITYQVALAYTEYPVPNAMFAIESNDVEPRLFRVLSISEEDKQISKVFAVQYEPTKFATVDGGAIDQAPPTDFSDLPDPSIVAPPENIEFEYNIRLRNGVQHGELTISWDSSPTPYVRNYRIAIQQADSNWVEYPVNVGTSYTLSDPILKIVRVAVYAVNHTGRLSLPAQSSIDLSTGGLQSKVAVYSLEITGGGAEWAGRNIHLSWKYRSPYTLQTAELPIVGLDPFLQKFVIEVWNAAGSVKLGELETTSTNFIIDYSKLVTFGLARAYKIKLYAIDKDDNASAAATLDASNPAPDLPLHTLVGKANSLTLNIAQPFDADFAGYLVWMDTSAGFTPGPSNKVWEGSGTPIIPVTAFTDYYYRYAAYDAFGQTGLTVSSEYSTTTPRLTANDIGDAILDTAKFAAGITPVELVATLPVSGNFDGRIVFLTTDKKLYRYDGDLSTWDTVGETDLANMVGQIVSTQIADDAITTPKIAANAVTAAEIAAGTITAAQIASDTITAGQIAAGAINTAELAAGAVVADRIAAATILGSNVAAGTLTADRMAAGNLTVAWNLGSSGKIILDGVNNRILITD